jgi:CheY-like chemotaxis protein
MNRLKDLELARVLLVDDDPASRLTLKTVLEAGGYAVDSAASAAEAFGKMEEQEYELVLTDLQMESPEAGLRVLQHARMMEYKPATALLTSSLDSDRDQCASVLIEPENLPDLFEQVAGLIGIRARRRLNRELRLAGVGA